MIDLEILNFGRRDVQTLPESIVIWEMGMGVPPVQLPPAGQLTG